MIFAALDFETANRKMESACAVGVVRVEKREVVMRLKSLIRPPTRTFAFSQLHGISAADVAHSPAFPEVWPAVESALDGVSFVAAHNAAFERHVIRACCLRFGMPIPNLRFLCTRRLARDTLGIRPGGLAQVARVLRIPLVHHDPLSDAEASASIVLTADAKTPLRLSS